MLQANYCHLLRATYICLLADDLPLRARVTWVAESNGQGTHVCGPPQGAPHGLGGWWVGNTESGNSLFIFWRPFLDKIFNVSEVSFPRL